jgi:mRNA-degrading endonuclease RelE of RelBE toxin-antitoxin system
MKVQLTARAEKDLGHLSSGLRQRFDRQVGQLLRDLRHPSLHAKKYDEARDAWRGSVAGSWRFCFWIVSDTYVILSVVPHPKSIRRANMKAVEHAS